MEDTWGILFLILFLKGPGRLEVGIEVVVIVVVGIVFVVGAAVAAAIFVDFFWNFCLLTLRLLSPLPTYENDSTGLGL